MDNPLSVALAVGCMAVYAVVIVMLKQFSAKYNVFVLCISYLPIQFAAMTAMYWITRTSGPTFNFPVGSAWWLIVLVGLLYTLGSTLNYSAYATGGSVAMVSCMTLLLPLFASITNYLVTRELPNAWHLAGYASGTLTLLFLVKGSLAGQVAKVVASTH